MKDFLIVMGRAVVLLFCAALVALLFAIPQCRAEAAGDHGVTEETEEPNVPGMMETVLVTVSDAGSMSAERIKIPAGDGLAVPMCIRRGQVQTIHCFVISRRGFVDMAKLHLKRLEV